MDYINAARNITIVVGLRVAIITLSIPVFILAMAVGLVEGLAARDIRRWCGGRESSYVYHRAKAWVVPVMLSSWVLYLSAPVSIHPSLAILPFAAAGGYLLAVAAASFKKYL